MSLFHAIILAIIEGLTEFLPVSSTGHMIIGSATMGIAANPFVKVFTVAIQFGAILSVLVLYWRRFLQSWNFYYKLFIAFLPAVFFGFFLKPYVDELLEHVEVVGLALIAGGILFLFLDDVFVRRSQLDSDISHITTGRAFKIGLFQVIAMVPGVSRSAATIIGGLTQNLSPKTAAEFSFFLAVPTMFGATCKSLWEYFWHEGGHITQDEIVLLTVGNIVAFIVALIAIRAFIQYLTNHGFKWFGYYRIVVGLIILVLWATGYFEGVDVGHF
ncbi:MAG: undecaprenyl-diphosphate phosphatase [Lewinellaceae bacterium]|nr:undecaprenyl-diphosphate phosphatase [Saprospiraceae bacterium]MCB9316586.1 undecaprenyl-diphosphate phosphatase [Lewinellaceae bacterium]MCB9331546.1 undecaprenyl-diphosphate phosphatase [Lewinellaceae bacterium]